MEKRDFERLLASPETAGPADWAALREETELHPSCAPLQVLSLMADRANGAPLWEKEALPRTALYVMDSAALYRRMEASSAPAAPPSAPASQPVPSPAPSPAPLTAAVPLTAASPDPDFDILREINSYQEVSFKTAPKSVILTNFLEKDGGITLDDGGYEQVSVQELAKNSLRSEGVLASETLALVLEKQYKYAQAIAVYEKIMSDNPEKSRTFAARIAELRARLEAK